jgi:hypothetical protein
MTFPARVATETFGLLLVRARQCGDLHDMLDPQARLWLAEALRHSASQLDPRPPRILRRFIPSHHRDATGRPLYREAP